MSGSTPWSAATVGISLALLRISDGRLLMQRRDGGTPISPYLLGFFGGHIEPGETASEAMDRELEEETSLRVATTRLSPLVTFQILPADHPDGTDLRVNVFTATVADADLDRLQVHEGTGAELYDVAELLARDDVAPTARAVLHAAGLHG